MWRMLTLSGSPMSVYEVHLVCKKKGFAESLSYRELA